MRPHRWIAPLLALALAACGTGVTPGAGSGDPTTGPSDPPASPSTDPAPTQTREVLVYTLATGDGRLYVTPEKRRVPATPRIARAALEAMVRGTPTDPDHFSPYPTAAQILDVRIADGTATVDWSAEVLEAQAGADVESLAIQQAVYTLIQFSSISRVRFLVEGKDRGTASNGRRIEDWWGHVGLHDQPFSPMDHIEAPVVVWSPANGATVGRTFTASGVASTFEANVGIRILDGSGRTIVHTSTTATEAAPGRGSWSLRVTLPRTAPAGEYVFEAYESSAEDGRTTFAETRTIRVTE